MKRRILYLQILVVTISILCVGCKKTDKFLGIGKDMIASCIIYIGEQEKIIDLENDDGKEFLSLFSEFLESNASKIGTLDGSIMLEESEMQNFFSQNKDNYYIYISFKEPQTMTFKDNQDETHSECDAILFDVEKMQLNWSMEKYFGASMGYAGYGDVDEDFSKTLEWIKRYIN